MNADERRFKHEDVTQRVIGVFFDVYNELGYGFLESVYKEAMAIALESAGLQVEKEFVLEARFRGEVVGVFKADLVVNGAVVVELKALRTLGTAQEAQTLNYLRAGVLEVALLLNFGPEPRSDAWHSRMIARVLGQVCYSHLALEEPLLRQVLSAFICVDLRPLAVSLAQPARIS